MSAPLEGTPAVHAALLAAGASRRLGRPKQLVRAFGETLIRRAACAALGADIASLTIVLGASAGAIAPEVADLSARIVENPRWEAGMGASIRCALAALPIAGEREGILLLTCDQIHVTSAHLDRQIEAFRAGAPIVASGYAGIAATPAIFAAAYRDELAALREAHGAKPLLSRHAPRVCVVPLPGGELDIDTARDVAAIEARIGAASGGSGNGGSA